MKTKLFIAGVILFICHLAVSQVPTTYSSTENMELKNLKSFKDKNLKVKTQKLSLPDMSELILEDELTNNIDKPFRFGAIINANISIDGDNWTIIDKGRVWCLSINSPGAYSLNFVFEDFYLPKGGELYITNKIGNMLYGPVTYSDITENGYFLTDILMGDEVTFYLFEPSDQIGLTSLTIKSVIHGYKDLFSSQQEDLDTSLSCNLDVSCYSGWTEESYGICLLLRAEGNSFCSGSLLMTTDNSYKPYILTAFHCLDRDKDYVLSTSEIADARNGMFKFNYKKTVCNGTGLATSFTYNGADFKSAWVRADFALLEMNTVPQAKWLSWDATDSNISSGTGIHHPDGDVMKISFYNSINIITADKYVQGRLLPAYHFFLSSLNNGAIEKGSSGSPLFNPEKRIVGMVSSGVPNCAPTSVDYGRLYNSWEGGGTSNTRLKDWLDPGNTGRRVTTSNYSMTLAGPEFVCNDGTTISYFTLANMGPVTGTIRWSTKAGDGTQEEGAVIRSGQGTTRVAVVSSRPFADVEDIIKVEVNGQVLTKTVKVGSCKVTTISGSTSPGSSAIYYAYPAYASGVDYEWKVTPASGASQSPVRDKNTVSFRTPGNYVISCRMINNSLGCGDQLTPTNLNVYYGGSYSAYVSNELLTILIHEDEPEDGINQTQSQTMNFEIYNQLTGHLAKKGTLPILTGVATVDLSSLSKGIYVARLYITGNQFETFKFSF